MAWMQPFLFIKFVKKGLFLFILLCCSNTCGFHPRQSPSGTAANFVHNTVLIQYNTDKLSIMSDTLEMINGTLLPSVPLRLSTFLFQEGKRSKDSSAPYSPLHVNTGLHMCLLQNKENEGEICGNLAKCVDGIHVT